MGKHLAKGEASRIIHHLVVEEYLLEDVKKSDIYGSVSSVLKVSLNSYLSRCSLGRIGSFKKERVHNCYFDLFPGE